MAIIKNIYCNDALFRDVIGASFDVEDITIRRQGVKILGVIADKLDAIFSMDVFENPGRNFKPVLSALMGKLPGLKHLSDFWKSEVELLNDQVSTDREYFGG